MQKVKYLRTDDVNTRIRGVFSFCYRCFRYADEIAVSKLNRFHYTFTFSDIQMWDSLVREGLETHIAYVYHSDVFERYHISFDFFDVFSDLKQLLDRECHAKTHLPF